MSAAIDPSAAVVGVDAFGSPALHAALPGLRRALDPDAMAADIQAHLLVAGTTVEDCRPGKCLYLGPVGCSVRYELEARLPGGTLQRMLVLGRVHPDDASAGSYVRSLERPARALRERGGAAGVDALVASLPDGIVVHPFPVDADLPSLVVATDPDRIEPLLRAAGLSFDHCVPVLGHYGRRHRCVLRYEIEGADVVYGKVCADARRGELVGQVLGALAGRLEGVELPLFIDHVPEWSLSLLGALPGRPALAGELAGTSGRPAAVVEAAAHAAAALHGSGVELGEPRQMEHELRELAGLLRLMVGISPQLAEAMRTLLDAIAAAAERTEPMPLTLGHGDFTPSQLLSDGASCGLVDFDGVAQMEPALDLGQYLAYLRLAVAKAGRAGVRVADDLTDHFLASYTATADRDRSEARFRARAQVYACVSLFRTTVHAWQKLKPARVHTVLPILAEEVACLPAVR